MEQFKRGTDGDGLNDSLEFNDPHLDPTTNDSDNDGILDGDEDFDGALNNSLEVTIGTDYNETDTDGDNVSDLFEYRWGVTNATVADTDNDSVLDGNEDPDGDGIPNWEEELEGAHPNSTDGDRDRLGDAAEIANDTDPLDPDTDNDGLVDGDELSAPFNTDPLVNDTDGDGVDDGNETYTTTRTNSSLDTTIEITGQGNASARVRIANANSTLYRGTDDERVSAIVRPDSYANYTQFNVTVGYNASKTAANNESALTLYRRDRAQDTLVAVKSEVNATADEVTATGLTTYADYVVLNATRWANTFNQSYPGRDEVSGTTTSALRPAPYVGDRHMQRYALADPTQPLYAASDYPCVGDATAADVMLVIDISGSMGQTDPGDRRQHAAKEYVGHLIESLDRVGVVGFAAASETSVKQPLTTDYSAVNTTLDNLGTNAEGRDVAAGINTAVNELQANGSDTYDQEIVVLTDEGESPHWGTPNQYDDSLSAANSAANSGIEVHTIGLNGHPDASPNSTHLQKLADTTTNGTFVSARRPATLEQAFEQVSVNSIPKVSGSDDDDLPDLWEATDSLPQDGFDKEFSSSPCKTDTDGDGLDDDEEIPPSAINASTVRGGSVSGTYLAAMPSPGTSGSHTGTITNPNSTDTDGDGLSDYNETNGWSVSVINRSGDVYRFDYRNQSPNDVVHWSSSPREAHTDGDGLTDLQEYNQTYTNPRAIQTYAITREHEASVASVRTITAREVGVYRSPGCSADRCSLTDATDDFDVVTQPDESGYNTFVFTALDGTERTDTWMHNTEELQEFGGTANGVKTVWDPDIDDDGLTDGQEHHYVTTAKGPLRQDYGSTFNTDPVHPDSDGDGYWDGWIGVYGVGYSENVVLYREHLQSGDGIQGDEIVQEQVEMYNGRSKVHIGELHWREFDNSQSPSPIDGSGEEVPDTYLEFEVDWYDQINQGYVNDMAERVHDIYSIYDLNVDLTLDEGISDARLQNEGINPPIGHSPYVDNEADNIEQSFHDTQDTAYFYIAHNYERDGLNAWDGYGHASSLGYDTQINQDSFGIIVFTFHTGPGQIQSPEELSVTSAEEVGHLLRVGTADDGTWNHPRAEVYSGARAADGVPEDNTPERVEIGGDLAREWSIMTSYGESIADGNGRYYFSIEELLTTEFNNIDSHNGG
jgi:hypothetical protein